MFFLLSVDTAVGLGGDFNPGGNANAVRVASGIVNTGRCPDRPGAVNAVGASKQIIAGELEVSVLDVPPLTLGVLGSTLGTSGISNLSLA